MVASSFVNKQTLFCENELCLLPGPAICLLCILSNSLRAAEKRWETRRDKTRGGNSYVVIEKKNADKACQNLRLSG
jgi:hypothetical protein